MNDDEYFDSEEFQELLNEYEESVKSGVPVYMDADDLADIADYYQFHDRYEDAVAAVNYALELQPGATLPLVFKIRDAISQGNMDSAMEYYQQIENPSDVEAQYVEAEILIAQDKIDEADYLLRKQFIDISPDELQDFVVDVANIYTDYGVYDKAMEWIMRGKQESTEDFKELMARTLFGLGKYTDSERIFNELIDKDPFQTKYWNALASAQFMREDYGASITSSEYAIAIDPNDPEGLLAKANGLFRLDNYEEALNYYERYTSQMPFDEFGLLHQGTCLINLGRDDEAAQRLTKALDVAASDSPYLVEIYQELGFAYSELHLPDTAIYYLEKTDSLECDHLDMLVIKGHILLANKRIEDAENMFKKAIIESRNAPKTILRIMVSLYDNRYVEATYKMFKQFFEMVNEDWHDGYSYMALCCWDIKKTDEFMHYLQLAVKHNPQEARVVLSQLFPKDIKPEEYYQYMIQKLRQ